MSLDSEMQEILELQRNISSAESKIGTKMRGLRKKILGGWSTGDPVRDFVIARHRTLSPEVERPYRETQERVDNNIGNQVLVVTQKEEGEGLPEIPIEGMSPAYTSVDTRLELGVLTSGMRLNVDTGWIILPTGKNAMLHNPYSSSRKWNLSDRSIYVADRDLQSLGKEIDEIESATNHDTDNLQRSLRLYFGDEVGQHFKERKGEVLYAQALKLLGLDLPGDIKGVYEKYIWKESVAIVAQLESLRAKITQSRSSREGEDTRDKIREYLTKGINRGLHLEGAKVKPRPGMVIDVSDYLLGMCEDYGVKVK